MTRKYTAYPVTDFDLLKTQLLNFGKRFSNFCFLDNHEYDFEKSYECIGGFGISRSITAGEKTILTDLDLFLQKNKDWTFGHLSYDLKNEFEDLSSNNPDEIRFPEFHFFVPQIVFILSKNKIELGVFDSQNSKEIFEQITQAQAPEKSGQKPEFHSRFSKEEYLNTVKKLQQHILKGDCYEICFCQEFFSENIQVNPFAVFSNLMKISPNPFSAFYKLDDKYLMSASPERFLKRKKNKLVSQPIKGTSRRSAETDTQEKSLLHSDEKERAENIMIVDLVRNDLSKICEEGSVAVDEFLKIYSFPQVHQMISTISGNVRDNISFSQIISALFPMGSMTGVPKKKVMELIEKYEKTKRGLFSGSVGYIDPDGNFDFNVVIRSILYNESRRYLSLQAGSAITWKSKPEKEYEECKIKIEAMIRSLD